jgi:seryl-tRNA synthetase
MMEMHMLYLATRHSVVETLEINNLVILISAGTSGFHYCKKYDHRQTHRTQERKESLGS